MHLKIAEDTNQSETPPKIYETGIFYDYFRDIPENTLRGVVWKIIQDINNSIIGVMQQHIRIVGNPTVDPELRGRWDREETIRTIDDYNDQCSAEEASDMSAYVSWAQGLAEKYEEEKNFVMTEYNEETGLNEQIHSERAPGINARQMSEYMFRAQQLNSLRAFFLQKLTASAKDPEDTEKSLSFQNVVAWRLANPMTGKKNDAEEYQKAIDEMGYGDRIKPEDFQAGDKIRRDRDQQIFKDNADDLLYRLEHLTTYNIDTPEQVDSFFRSLPVNTRIRLLKSIYAGIQKQEINILRQVKEGYFDNMPNLAILKAIIDRLDKDIKATQHLQYVGSSDETAISF